MKSITWHIPAKTFLIGEYAALNHQSAILLTTTPCFTLTLTQEQGLHGIHADSPAGRFWLTVPQQQFGLKFDDPYQGIGGMGASSAQFIGAYLAKTHLNKQTPSLEAMLTTYWDFSYNGQGLRPSGYDLIAQSMSECVYINRNRQQYDALAWSFSDIGFLLAHTNNKLATHVHLAKTALPKETTGLDAIVAEAKNAFLHNDSHALITAVTAYHNALTSMSLVDSNTLRLLAHLQKQSPILATKGCGALGADVILCIIPKEATDTVSKILESLQLTVIASHESLRNTAPHFFH